MENIERFSIRVNEIVQTFLAIATQAGPVPESAGAFIDIQRHHPDALVEAVLSHIPERVQILLGSTGPTSVSDLIEQLPRRKNGYQNGVYALLGQKQQVYAVYVGCSDQLTTRLSRHRYASRTGRNRHRVHAVLSEADWQVHARFFVQEKDHIPRGILMLIESVIMVSIDSIESINHLRHPAGCEIRFRAMQEQLGLGLNGYHLRLNYSLSILCTFEWGLQRDKPDACEECGRKTYLIDSAKYGKWLCDPCYKRAYIAAMSPDNPRGQPCQLCHQRPTTQPLAPFKGGWICQRCKRAYERLGHLPETITLPASEEDIKNRWCSCGDCTKVGYEVRRMQSDGTRMCDACHRNRKRYGTNKVHYHPSDNCACDGCPVTGKDRVKYHHPEDGTKICERCYRQIRKGNHRHEHPAVEPPRTRTVPDDRVCACDGCLERGHGPVWKPQNDGSYMCAACDAWAKKHPAEPHWHSDGAKPADRVCQCPGCPKKGASVDWRKWPDGNFACATCQKYRDENTDSWWNHDHRLMKKSRRL